MHKETWVGLAIKLWGFTSCVGVNSSVKHTRARKHQHKNEFFFEVSLAKLKVVGWGSFYEQNKQQNVLQKGLNNYNTT